MVHERCTYLIGKYALKKRNAEGRVDLVIGGRVINDLLVGEVQHIAVHLRETQWIQFFSLTGLLHDFQVLCPLLGDYFTAFRLFFLLVCDSFLVVEV